MLPAPERAGNPSTGCLDGAEPGAGVDSRRTDRARSMPRPGPCRTGRPCGRGGRRRRRAGPDAEPGANGVGGGKAPARVMIARVTAAGGPACRLGPPSRPPDEQQRGVVAEGALVVAEDLPDEPAQQLLGLVVPG
jgi:hypothetical protein